jgi:hypothetical protein
MSKKTTESQSTRSRESLEYSRQRLIAFGEAIAVATRKDLKADRVVLGALIQPTSKKSMEIVTPSASTRAKVLAKLNSMSREQLLQTFIDAGILTQNGKLSENYGGMSSQ